MIVSTTLLFLASVYSPIFGGSLLINEQGHTVRADCTKWERDDRGVWRSSVNPMMLGSNGSGVGTSSVNINGQDIYALLQSQCFDASFPARKGASP